MLHKTESGHNHSLQGQGATPQGSSYEPCSIFTETEGVFQNICGRTGLVFTNILILRIVLFLEFSKNFIELWEIF